MIYKEREVLDYLNIPSVPRKAWDGRSSFKDGVAVLKTDRDEEYYGVATFDAESDLKPRIKKVFSLVPFSSVGNIYVVPSYMDDDVASFDLADEESRKAAERILEEAKEMEMEGVKREEFQIPEKNEYIFDFITNDEEGVAFIRQYNKQKGINKGRVPQQHDSIIMRLAAIYAEQHDKKK